MEPKSVKWYPVSFRGQDVKVAEGRIDPWNLEPGFTYYEFQSTDGNWSKPSTLHESVRLNFWGMMAVPKPFAEIDRVTSITLTEPEIDAIMKAIAGRPCTVQEGLRDAEAKPHGSPRSFWR